MKKLIVLLTLILIGCTSTKTVYIPTESQHTVEYRDSLIYLIDTIYINIPNEQANNIVADTSRLETSVAYSIAYLDTTNNKINHTLTNKNTKLQIIRDTVIVTQNVKEYIEKPVIQEVEKPVPYIPKVFWVSMWFSIICIVIIAIKFIKII